MISIVKGFIKREFQTAKSYRLAFFASIGQAFFQVVMFYFFSRFVDQGGIFPIFGKDFHFFAYIITGIAFFQLLIPLLGGVGSQIRHEQMMGTLELLFSFQIPPIRLFMGMMCWNLLFAVFNLVLYLVIGRFLFGADLHFLNNGWWILVLLLTMITLLPLSFLSGSMILLFKKGDPEALLTGGLTLLFCGVYFPPQELPQWLYPVSQMLPMTHALDLFRASLGVIQAPDTEWIWRKIGFLCGWGVVLWTMALWLVGKSLKTAKKWGTLSSY